MFSLDKRDGPSPRCYFTSSMLPGFVNHDQLPTKKKPFSTVLSQTFNHSLNVVLSRNEAETLQNSITHGTGTLRYLTVCMKLEDLIEGDFFNHYIKTGNILMLSEGRPEIDRTFSLCEGILRLEVDKPTYERMGLQGKAIPSKGRKHVKARFAIELNLRLPSMVRGKSGFERIIWAFHNVLNDSLKWLFYDMKGRNDGSGAIAAHQPNVRELEPEVNTLENVAIPGFDQEFGENDYERASELLEWVTLMISKSPRVKHDDAIDPYLSRYRVPPVIDDFSETAGPNVQDLVKFHWQGFIPPAFIQNVLLTTLKVTGAEWFALSAAAFDGKAYAFIQNKDHTMTWEYED